MIYACTIFTTFKLIEVEWYTKTYPMQSEKKMHEALNIYVGNTNYLQLKLIHTHVGKTQ